MNCNKCCIDLYNQVYSKAIKCNMDKSTIVNLKETHQKQVDSDFRWSGYKQWLLELRKIYDRNIKDMEIKNDN